MPAFRQAGEDEEPAGASMTCDGCGHGFLPGITSFDTDIGDDAFRIELPNLGVTCPRCGASVT